MNSMAVIHWFVVFGLSKYSQQIDANTSKVTKKRTLFGLMCLLLVIPDVISAPTPRTEPRTEPKFERENVPKLRSAKLFGAVTGKSDRTRQRYGNNTVIVYIREQCEDPDVNITGVEEFLKAEEFKGLNIELMDRNRK